MAKAVKVILIVTMLAFAISSPLSHAQAGSDRTKVSGPRKQLTTIVFSGLAGAVLGLSTLSFYGRPQDRLSNIAVGFAVGVIIGTGYTTYQAATQPKSFYGFENRYSPESEVLLLQPTTLSQAQSYTPSLGYSWTF